MNFCNGPSSSYPYAPAPWAAPTSARRILKKGKQSARAASTLCWFKASTETNIVTWSNALTSTAPAAYTAKFLTAGIPTAAPNANAMVSVEAERRILGPILPNAFAILVSISSSGWLMLTRSNSCTIRKMLSTPTASTRNGMTSAMIRVTLIPQAEKRPTEAETDINTMTMPMTPRVNLDCTIAFAGLCNIDRTVRVVDPRASEA